MADEELSGRRQSSSAADVFQSIEVGPPMVDRPKQEKGPDYEPTELDVLCGRGSGVFLHPGNQRFREIVHRHSQRYFQTSRRMEKSLSSWRL